MYETMIGCKTDPTPAAQSDLMRGFAQIWRTARRPRTCHALDVAARKSG
jgi:hypothetical protein